MKKGRKLREIKKGKQPDEIKKERKKERKGGVEDKPLYIIPSVFHCKREGERKEGQR